MRFPKLILTVCAVGAGSLVLLAQNSDQETYDKALRALRQQVAVSEGRAGSTGAASGTLEAEKERQARQALETLRGGMAPRALAAEPAPRGLTAQQQQRLDAEKERQARQSLYGNQTQVAAVGTLDAEKEAKARQALDRLNRGGIDQRALAIGPAPTTRPASVATTAPAARPAPAVAQQPARLPVATTYVALAPELEAKARTVLSGLIVAEQGGSDMVQMASTGAVEIEAAPEAVARPAGPMTRREKLAALLEEYKLDVITPRQYQERRAEILASN